MLKSVIRGSKAAVGQTGAKRAQRRMRIGMPMAIQMRMVVRCRSSAQFQPSDQTMNAQALSLWQHSSAHSQLRWALRQNRALGEKRYEHDCAQQIIRCRLEERFVAPERAGGQRQIVAAGARKVVCRGPTRDRGGGL